MDQYNWEQLTSQQTLAAIAQAAMEKSPASRKKIEEVLQVLSSTLANLQGTTDELREQHDVLIDSYRNIAEYSHHYQHVFAQAPQSLVITDEEGKIQDLNFAAIQLLGDPLGKNGENAGTSCHVDRTALLEQSLQSFVAPESVQVFAQYLEDVRRLSPIKQASLPSIQVLIDPILGQQQWVHISARCISAVLNEGRVISWAITDITDVSQTEFALKRQIQEIHQNYADIQRANQALEKTVQAKSSQVLKATEFESTLKRITDKVRDSLDESKILQTVVRELSIVLRLGGCNTALYDLDKGISTISYEYTNFISAYRGKVAQMDKFPEIYNQLKQGNYFQFCSLIPNPERGHVSLLACPIFVDSETEEAIAEAHESDSKEPPNNGMSREKVLGDLWLIDRKEHVFNEFEIRLVQQVANQCAIAIRQARLYKAAQAQVHELEKLNRLKDEFLSTVSHELRTPISNVKMAIHMLKNAPTEEKRQQYLKILEAESQREADLIDDLLDLQKLEVSTYSISARTLQIGPWLESITQPFKSRMESQQQHMSIGYSTPRRTLRTDFGVLERILVELLNNACKYTPSGHKIQVQVYDEGDEEKNGADLNLLVSSSTVFKVSNQAEITEDELPHIFDKFYRIPHSDPWKQGGTGLGLALVQKLVEQIQGKIEVSSLDGWTHFTVSIIHHD
ncbi:MAG: ATP-binding protein [Cyanobacteria bacterium P01_F01_bin.150]